MKIEFGVMSSKYELETDDKILGEIAMCLFIKKNIPIAIYKPYSKAISPKNILEKNFVYSQSKNKELIKVLDSIKEK